MIKKIVSGGQTGADQAALDAAIETGIPHGGWIPKGRKTEPEPLSSKYDHFRVGRDLYERMNRNVDVQGICDQTNPMES